MNAVLINVVLDRSLDPDFLTPVIGDFRRLAVDIGARDLRLRRVRGGRDALIGAAVIDRPILVGLCPALTAVSLPRLSVDRLQELPQAILEVGVEQDARFFDVDPEGLVQLMSEIELNPKQ
jgi:hypothetical protein